MRIKSSAAALTSVICAVVLSGCDDSLPPLPDGPVTRQDSGPPPDGPRIDRAPPVDAAIFDLPRLDGPAIDQTPPTDLTPPDGPTPDGATPDGATPDAAQPDAAPPVDLGQPDTCVAGPEICGNNDDENCNGVPDDPALCDIGQLVEIVASPAGGAWAAADVGFQLNLAASVVGHAECRWGKVASNNTISGTFRSCGPGTVKPTHNPTSTGNGLYRTEIRVVHDDGTVSEVLQLDYYLHRSLDGATQCKLATSDAQVFAKALERLPVANVQGTVLTFDPGAARTTAGAAQLKNPFVRVNFTPRVNRKFAFRYGISPAWVRGDGVLEVLSLRRRFTLSADRRLLLMARRYGSRRLKAAYNFDSCHAFSVRVHANTSDAYHACSAVVLNREGAGVCLRVDANGVVTFARNPSPTLFSKLANNLLTPPDQPLVNSVDNAMWRKIGARHNPNVNSTYNRANCNSSTYSTCADNGVSARYGWKQFSPKCYGLATCVTALNLADLRRTPGAGFNALFLPDHQHFGL